MFVYSNSVGGSISWQFGHSEQLPGAVHAGTRQVAPLHPVPPRHGGPRLHAGLPGHQAIPTRQSGNSEYLALMIALA